MPKRRRKFQTRTKTKAYKKKDIFKKEERKIVKRPVFQQPVTPTKTPKQLHNERCRIKSFEDSIKALENAIKHIPKPCTHNKIINDGITTCSLCSFKSIAFLSPL